MVATVSQLPGVPVAICRRWIRNPISLSELSFQVRLICVPETVVATSSVGAFGG
jgi:hypothetical protein